MGSRLQKFSQLTEDDFLVHLRSPGRTDRLLISLHPERSRFHLLLSGQPPAIVPSSFVMLCRKQVGGTRLEEVVGFGLDRKLEFRFHSGYSLVFDWAGRPSALLLLKTEERTVAGAFPPRGRFRIRSEYPAEVSDEESALSLSSAAAWESFRSHPTLSVYDALDQICQDWAPLWKKRFARELGVEQAGEVEKASFIETWERFITPLQMGLLGSLKFSPGLLGGELTYAADNPAYQTMQHAANAKWASSSKAPGVDDFRDELLKKLKKSREKAERKLKKREQDRRGAQSAPQDQLKGDLLLAYGTGIARGTEKFETTDWEGKPLAIALDPKLGSSANAERYYNKAKKKRRALEFLEEQIQLAKDEIAGWDELIFAAKTSENRTDLDQVRQSMPTSQSKKKRKTPQIPSSGPRRYEHGGFQIWVGRNPAQNEKLSLKTAAKDDHWFHVRQGAGSHVLIRCAGAEPGPDTVHAAAWLAGRFSQSSESPTVEVVTTRARFLKKPKGGHLGKVIYRQETEIVIDPTSTTPEGLMEQNKNGNFE